MKEVLKNRTKKFATDCWGLCTKFPVSREYNAFCNQLIRCSSSVGANYRAACRAKSTADFINKLKIVEDGLLRERLHTEGNELLSIIVASIKTMRNHKS